MDTAGYTDDDNILSHHREHPNTHFHKHLHSAATKGRIHDVLQFNNGANRMGVVSWNIMEYLPFRRMDLQEDGTCMGQWVVACDEGHHVGECFKRRHPPERTKTDEMEQPACDGGMQVSFL
jgi:hypothetical protein